MIAEASCRCLNAARPGRGWIIQKVAATGVDFAYPIKLKVKAVFSNIFLARNRRD
jgi:hypothetical protein